MSIRRVSKSDVTRSPVPYRSQLVIIGGWSLSQDDQDVWPEWKGKGTHTQCWW